jgi:dTMP kinase
VLVTIEGIDGAGKTTLAAALADRLGAALLRDPGGVEASERIRAIVKDPDLVVGARTEALLYAAARAELVDQAVRPRLEAGETVVLDRFVDSTLAYQGAARGLGVKTIAEINAFATGGLRPDVTLLLRLSPAEARARRDTRIEAPDRFGRENDGFYATIAAAYDAFAAADPARFRVLDATLAPGALLDAALSALART